MAVTPSRTVAVAGAGISGLAVAARLAAVGYKVIVLEKNHWPGGKLTCMEQEGFYFDMGPSLFTMPRLMEELFADCGKNISDYFQYRSLPEITRYFFHGGKRLTASASPEQFAETCRQVLGEPAEKVKKYLEDAGILFGLTEELFLGQSLHKLSGFLNLKTLRLIFNIRRMHLFDTLHSFNSKRFSTPEMVQLFNRFATYNGSSPYKTPATLSVIPHLEFGIGAYLPKNGMHDITKAVFALAKDLGVEFCFGEEIVRIQHARGKVDGVQTPVRFIPADLVVSNADVFHTYTRFLPELKIPSRVKTAEPSSSGLIFYWGINRSFPELCLHNIFFGKDYPGEFRFLFEKGDVPEDVTIYLNITSKHCSGHAPEGCENWFVMVNVPSAPSRVGAECQDRIRSMVIKRLSEELGCSISEHIVLEQRLDPAGIELRTGSTHGALYGSSSNSPLSAFLRHRNDSKKMKGLYFCGGSVHPGGGIPLCLYSAKITAGLIR